MTQSAHGVLRRELIDTRVESARHDGAVVIRRIYDTTDTSAMLATVELPDGSRETVPFSALDADDDTDTDVGGAGQ